MAITNDFIGVPLGLLVSQPIMRLQKVRQSYAMFTLISFSDSHLRACLIRVRTKRQRQEL